MRFQRKTRTLGAVLALWAGAHAVCAAPGGQLTDAVINQAAQASYREFVELLAIPNVASEPADIQKNAEWLKAAFSRRGFSARLLENNGRPMLFAEYGANPGTAADQRKTVLLYMHMDGQPVTPSEWQQASPWQVTLKRKDAQGKWEPLPLQQLYEGPIDPEWRLFARASSDDKGPIMMLLAAIDALRAQRVEPAVNVKVILDSEEEVGSPGLARVIEANREQLKANALVVFDGPMHASNRPTLVYGNRGILTLTLTVFGPKNALHSGHYGNYAPNPAFRLAQLLTSMKDDGGRVTIPGYYDKVKLDDAARTIMAAVPDNEDALRKRLGIAETDKVGANYQEALQYPSLNVRGLKAADIGTKARTIIPDTATAEIDIRTVPETSPQALFDLVKKHVEQQGYHLIDGQPTDEDRARYSKLASLTYQGVSSSSSAVRTDMNAPVSQWAYRAFVKVYDAEPVRIRMMGGTVPTGAAVEALDDIPFVIIPFVNADNNQHANDENLRLGNYVDGIRGIAGLLQQPF